MRMKRRKHEVRVGKHGRLRRNRHSSIFWEKVKKKKRWMRLKTMTLFLWSEMKAKWGKEGEGGKDKRNKDWWREQSLTETALMIPYSVSQLQIKTTSTQKQSRSPELQNNLIGSAGWYKCVGGWVYSLWSIPFSIVLPIASHFQFIIMCFKYLDIEFVSIPIRHLLKHKQVDKLALSMIGITSFHAVSLSLVWDEKE